MTADSIVAAVARLRANMENDRIGSSHDDDLRLVLSALEAAQAAQAAMPPREPTPEMVAAGTAAHSRSPVFEAQRIIDIWYAMHDAHTFAEDSARYYGFPPDDAGPLDHQPCIERGCPNPSLMPASEYCAYHARREPQAAADGPAADPLSHAWKSGYAQAKEEDELAQRFCPHCNPCQHDGDERCRAPAADPSPVDYRYLFTDPITRVPIWRHESREWNGQHPVRSEPLYSADALKRLRAERDTLAAIVRAADAMHLKPTMDNINAWLEARAKWEGK